MVKDNKQYQEENSNNNLFYSQHTVFSQCHRIEITNLQKKIEAQLIIWWFQKKIGFCEYLD